MRRTVRSLYYRGLCSHNRRRGKLEKKELFQASESVCSVLFVEKCADGLPNRLNCGVADNHPDMANAGAE